MKKIAYTVIDNGIDGREKDRIVYADYDEAKRDEWYDKSKNKNWYRKGQEIIDPETIKKEVVARMNGIEKMVMSEGARTFSEVVEAVNKMNGSGAAPAPC